MSNKNKKTILEIFFIIILGVILSINTLLPICKVYKNSDFDSQATLFWDYTATKHIPIYQKIFYPYGVLSYLRNENIIIHYSYIVLFILILTITFLCLKKIWLRTIHAYIAFTFFIIFIYLFPGVDTFVRYGILFSLALIIPHMMLSRSKMLFLGFLSSFITFFYPDQGVPSVLLSLILIFASRIIFKAYFKQIFASLFYFIFGLFAGIVVLMPFFGYQYLLYNLKFIGDLVLIAKTPFIPSLRSHENIFTLSILLISVGYLSHTFLFKKNIKTFNVSLFFSILTGLIILEQKNIIRSIDSQLTFFAFFLTILLLNEFIKKIRKNYQTLSLITLLTITTFGPHFHLNNSLATPLWNVNSLKTCITENELNLSKKTPSYENIIKFLKTFSDFNSKVISFPGDPLFYVLLNQPPPYYSQIYDGSSFESQEKIINFIYKENVKYAIINTKIKSIQDGVPDYVRAPLELSYILNNFEAIKQVGNFIVLKKSSSFDFFKSKTLMDNKNFQNYLLSINFGNIIKSEGYYKYNLIKNEKNKKIFNSFSNLNNFLKNKTFYSSDNILVITPLNQTSTTTTIKISSENIESDLTFNSCLYLQPCLIHFKRIPLFYKNRKITSLNPIFPFKAKIEILNYNPNLW